MLLKILDDKLEQIFKENTIGGMSVAVTDREKIVYKKGFGVLNVEHPEFLTTPDALYRIASVTKIITGMTILILADKGILDIDVPIKKYIPWLTLSRQEACEQITLRALLSHTSGLPRGVITEGSRDENTVEQSLKQLLPECEITSLPSEKIYQYSNIGVSLAGLVASTVTGKSYSQLASEYVLKPLGMNVSTYDFHEAATYLFSLPHQQDESGNLRVQHYIRMNTMFRASGGLYSNAQDLSKLARCILNNGKSDCGEQILSANSFEQMCIPNGIMSEDTADRYGLTMCLFKYKERFLYGHTGASKPYATSVITDKKTGCGVVTLMNTNHLDLRVKIPKMIFDLFDNDKN